MNSEQREDRLEHTENSEPKTKSRRETAKAKKSPQSNKRSGQAATDSYIRLLMGIAALTIIGALLTVIFAYMGGVIDFADNRPATLSEFTLARGTALAEAERTSSTLGQLAIAQIANNRFVEAERTIQEAFALNDPIEERHQMPLYAYALLAKQQGNNQLAIERFEEVMSRMRYDFERVFNSDIDPNWAQAFGLHDNYFEAALALAVLYRDDDDYDRALEMYDIAAEGMPTNADIFLFRGQLLLEMGDNEAAIENFNEALRFIPDDADVLAGLEEAGGTVNE